MDRSDRGQASTRPPAEAGVSEIVGTLLLTGIAVVLVSGFVLALFNLPAPTDATHPTIQAFVLPNAENRLVLEHRGGPTVLLSALSANVRVNATTTFAQVVGTNLCGTTDCWIVTSESGTVKTANDRFVPGDQAVFVSNSLFQASATVQLVDTGPNALLLPPASVLSAQDVTSPNFTAARTSTTSSIIVNFTKPLLTISKYDFLVYGAYPSSVALLGNGSSAEFVNATAFPTSATPALQTNTTVAGTRDLAGNLFGSASGTTLQFVNASDGVAPTFVDGPTTGSTTVTATGASIYWNTSESATTALSYGPTPAYGIPANGLTGTGTFHAVNLSPLTDLMQYYYAATSVDAGGNPVTATGQFSTPVASGGSGGGGGGATATADHLAITTLPTLPLTSGSVSTNFTLTLRDVNGTTVAAAQAITVDLSTNSTVGYFVSPVDGVTINRTVTILQGASTVDFKYVDYRPGGASLLTAFADSTIPASAPVTITGSSGRGLPYHLDFTTQVSSLAASAQGTFTLQLRDSNNAPAPTPLPWAVTVNLSTNSTGGIFRNATTSNLIASVVIDANNNAVSFNYTDIRNGNSTILAVANDTLPVMTIVSITGGINPQPVHFEFSSPILTMAAGSTQTFTVQLKDANSSLVTPTSALTLLLSTNSSTGAFFNATTSSPEASVTWSTGEAQTTFKYTDTRPPGNSTILVVANGVTPAMASFSVTGGSSPPGSGSNHFEITGPTTLASGTTGSYTLSLKDASGNLVTPTNLDVFLSTNSSVAHFNASGGAPTGHFSMSASSVTLQYADYRSASNSTLWAAANGTIPAAYVVSVTGASTGGTPWRLSLSGPTSVDPGITSSAFTVTLLDAGGNAIMAPAGGLVVGLVTNGTLGEFVETTAGATLGADIDHVTITAGTPSATFKYVTNFTMGGTDRILALATGLVPDSVAVTVNARGVFATNDDSQASITVTMTATSETARAAGTTRISVVVTNPTPTAKTLSSVDIVSAGLANYWNANPTFLGGGSDGIFTTCTWTRVASNTVARCDFTDDVINAYDTQQFTITYAVVSGTAANVRLSTTVYFPSGTPAFVTSPALMQEVTNTNTAPTLSALAWDGSNNLGAFPGVAPGTTATYQIRITDLNGAQPAGREELEILVPWGWTNLNATTLPDATSSVAVRQPTSSVPGLIRFTDSTALASGGTRTYQWTMKAPPLASGSLQQFFVLYRESVTANEIDNYMIFPVALA